MGFKRIPSSERPLLMAKLFSAFLQKPIVHQARYIDGLTLTFDCRFFNISNVFSILQMVLPCFDSLTLPAKLEERKAMFGMDKNSDLQPTLLDFMMDALLLPYKSVTCTCLIPSNTVA